jgi:hypothetical protein
LNKSKIIGVFFPVVKKSINLPGVAITISVAGGEVDDDDDEDEEDEEDDDEDDDDDDDDDDAEPDKSKD